MNKESLTKKVIKKLSKTEVQIGTDALDKDVSLQKRFKPIEKCVHCGEDARIAFAITEKYIEGIKDKFICDLNKNEKISGGPFWPHDAVSVAVYFCTKCAEATAKWNQA